MRQRSGVTVLEVVVACLILAAVMIPLMELFQGGLRTTRATIQEVVGTNLAAELAEQLETLPFEVLRRACEDGPREYSSLDHTLEDGAELAPYAGWAFRLTRLPAAFRRSLTLELVEGDLVHAEIHVGWTVGRRRERDVVLRRALTRDSLLTE